MISKITLAISTAILLVFCLSCSKEDEDLSSTEEFEEFLEDEMEEQNIPAMAVLIFNDATIKYQGYKGKSQIQQNKSLQANHLFLMASISKVVTATALVQLYDDGLFILDEKINGHLPFDVNIPNHSQDITFRMLLTHTSGIADGSALDSQYYNEVDSPVDLGDFLESYLVPGGTNYNASENFHDFSPGSDHEYSNVGSALIGHLVEEISGMSFNAYC